MWIVCVCPSVADVTSPNCNVYSGNAVTRFTTTRLLERSLQTIAMANISHFHRAIATVTGGLRRLSLQTENEIFLSIVYMGGNSKMAVENKRCRGDGPSSSLLSSSGPEGERLSKILCISIPVQWFQTVTRIDKWKFWSYSVEHCRDFSLLLP